MKKRLVLFLVLVLSMTMVGCSSGASDNVTDSSQMTKEITEEEKEDVISEFLVDFFGLNCDGRYDTFMKEVEGIDYLANAEVSEEGIAELPKEFQDAYDNYFDELSKYATEDCIRTMKANRLPIQLDMFAKEKEIKDSIDYIELDYSEGDENVYSYAVHFEAYEGETYFTEPLRGQVSVEIVDGEVKISSISIVQ